MPDPRQRNTRHLATKVEPVVLNELAGPKLEEAYGRYQSYQVDAIKGIETVKALGGEPEFRILMLRQFQTVLLVQVVDFKTSRKQEFICTDLFFSVFRNVVLVLDITEDLL